MPRGSSSETTSVVVLSVPATSPDLITAADRPPASEPPSAGARAPRARAPRTRRRRPAHATSPCGSIGSPKARPRRGSDGPAPVPARLRPSAVGPPDPDRDTGAPVGRAIRAIPLRIRWSSPASGFTAPSGAIAATAPRRIVAIASSRAPGVALVRGGPGSGGSVRRNQPLTGTSEDLRRDEEPHGPSASPGDLGREARPVEDADVHEREDRRTLQRNVVDAGHADPEQRAHDQLGDRHAEPPPDVQVAAEGSLAPERRSVTRSNTTTERITSPASIARKASSRSVEAELARHHPVEVESPLERPAGHLGEVLRRDRIAAVGDQERRLPWVGGMLGPVPRQRDLGGDRRHADRHRDPGVVEHRHRLRHHRGDPGRLEREVDAVALRELANRRDGVGRRMRRPCRSPRTASPTRASARRRPRRSAARRPRSSPPAAPRDRSRRGRSPRRGRRATPSPSGSPRRRRWRRRSRADRRSAAGAPAASGSPAPRGRRCAWRACRARASPRAARRPAPGGRAEAAATHGSSGAGRRAGTVRTCRTGPPTPARRGRPREGVSTPSPTSSTTPAPSWPSSIGNGAPQFPFSIAQRSEWQTPLAARRTRTSPGPGASIVRSSMRTSAPTTSTTAPIASRVTRLPSAASGSC